MNLLAVEDSRGHTFTPKTQRGLTRADRITKPKKKAKSARREWYGLHGPFEKICPKEIKDSVEFVLNFVKWFRDPETRKGEDFIGELQTLAFATSGIMDESERTGDIDAAWVCAAEHIFRSYLFNLSSDQADAFRWYLAPCRPALHDLVGHWIDSIGLLATKHPDEKNKQVVFDAMFGIESGIKAMEKALA